MNTDYGYIREFQELGLGLFVHFGLYSVIGKGEWYSSKMQGEERRAYEKTAEKFAVKKNWAKELVAVAVAAGAKYINITTRHHDGFSLYDARGLSDFDAPHSASGRDLIAEFVQACNEKGILPFFYHTLLDWHNEDYQKNFPAYIDYLTDSVELLCKNYGKIGGFWFDGYWDKPDADWKFDRLYGTIRRWQPTAMIINNTGLNALGQVSHREIDSVTFERGRPSFVDNSDRPRAGEMCEGLTDHWGYAERDLCTKSIREVVETYVDCRRYGCNLLLNTGLTGDGSVTAAERDVLCGLGKWISYTGGFLYEAVPSAVRADGAAVLAGKDGLYLCVNRVPMEANANVTRAEDKRTVRLRTRRNVLSAVWLDNGKEVSREGHTLVVDPFEYGTSLGCRVAKVQLTKPRIAFLGDSITAGCAATRPELTYTALVGRRLGCETDVYGEGGTRIARQTVPSADPAYDRDFLVRAGEMGDADFVFVFGGTNDYGHGDAPMGDLQSTDCHTFCGAVRTLAQTLSDRYGKENLCFILPLRRYGEDDPRGEFGAQTKTRPPLGGYVGAETAVLREMGISYLNLREVFPAPETNAPSEYYADGLHPTDKGHALLADCIVNYLTDRGIV